MCGSIQNCLPIERVAAMSDFFKAKAGVDFNIGLTFKFILYLANKWVCDHVV